MIMYISDHSLLACSDGSFDPKVGLGSHSWLFADPEGMLLWSGAGPSDGHPNLMSSYRTELGGVTTILYLISVLVQNSDILDGSVTIYCDNQGALDNIFAEFPKWGIYPLLEVDYD
jgi:hypothetical protein